jgi:hypothetical protein
VSCTVVLPHFSLTILMSLSNRIVMIYEELISKFNFMARALWAITFIFNGEWFIYNSLLYGG